jgi:hypothetical protein
LWVGARMNTYMSEAVLTKVRYDVEHIINDYLKTLEIDPYDVVTLYVVNEIMELFENVFGERLV